MFGRRKNFGNTDFPWTGDIHSAPACNFALNHLRENLMARVSVEGHIHAETLLSSIGCIAGFANQVSVFKNMRANNISFSPPELNIVRVTNGKEYFYGEHLNQGLLNDVHGDMKKLSFWALAAGAAMQIKGGTKAVPKWEDMFVHVTKQIGSMTNDLRVGSYSQPHLPPEELLKSVWPLARTYFNGKFPNTDKEFGIAPTKYWPVICGYIANEYIVKTKDVIDPTVAVTICMESAIYCSKIKNFDE